MKKALLVIAQNGYQDMELDGTRKGLLESEFEIVICSKKIGKCAGKFGGSENAVVRMCDADMAEYDCVAFIGGPGAAMLASDGDALNLTYRAVNKGIPVGAICIAPLILAKAKVLNGKRATVWDSEGEQIALLKKQGAVYTGDDVTIDGKIVTANGPDAAVEFGRTLAGIR